MDLALTPSVLHNKHRFSASCSLYSGPPNGSASIIARWTLAFGIHGPAPAHYVPSSVNGLVDVNRVESLTADLIPREIYLACQGGPDAVWTHPSITFELTTGSVFHQTVGPALPKKPVIGPGTLQKVFGTG